MQTVFSHIVQKRFSQVNEDVATDALAFILHSSESARNGMIKLLRGVVPNMPDLQFRTQQTEGGIRPDMWGYDQSKPRVFIENKFWAGLTENQPIPYLKKLADYEQPTVLLVVVPEAREQTLWRELSRRLSNDNITAINRENSAGIVQSITTECGPILALTSWSKLLSALELEVADDRAARSDLLQLRALCEAADSEAFLPVSSEELSDQRAPAFILQLNTVVQAAVELAITEGVLSIKRLNPQASWDRIGRYARLSGEQGVGMWIGIHFGLWKKHGGTPIWLFFSQESFSRSAEVRPLLEPWASKEGVFTIYQNGDYAVAIDIESGVDKEQVIRKIVDRLKGIAEVLSSLNPKPTGSENS